MTPERFRNMVSLILALGVGLSAVLIAFGYAGALAVGWHGSILGGATHQSATTDFSDLPDRLVDLQPLAITQLGLLALLATPIVRVAASMVGFALERDRLYAAITLAVLAILLASVFVIR
jgi:uncharacterized membrane protein